MVGKIEIKNAQKIYKGPDGENVVAINGCSSFWQSLRLSEVLTARK